MYNSVQWYKIIIIINILFTYWLKIIILRININIIALNYFDWYYKQYSGDFLDSVLKLIYKKWKVGERGSFENWRFKKINKIKNFKIYLKWSCKNISKKIYLSKIIKTKIKFLISIF